MTAIRPLPAALLVAALLVAATAPATAQDTTPTDDAVFRSISTRLRSIAENVGPSVVQIFTAAYGPVGGQPGQAAMTFGTQRSTGSGVIVDPDGYIVTNAHVVDGARRVQVLLSARLHGGNAGQSSVGEGGLLLGARIVGVDRETDLAVLKVTSPDPLPALAFGDSDALFQGQLVFAFGSPLGLTNSVSMGVVSAVARQLEQESPMIYIQTDAAVNPGNSGGPLVTATGEVVGINTLIFSQSGGYEGLSFAAPSNIVRVVYEQLRANGRVRRGMIGVTAQTISPWLADGLDLPRDYGVILGDVLPQSPADKAGLKVGDIVLSLDGKPMENGRQFHVNIYGKPFDRDTQVEVLRGGKTVTVPVRVMERQEHSLRFFDLVTPQDNLIRKLGVLALDLDENTAALLPPTRRKTGVIVAAPTADASVLGQSLLPGDVIYSLNGAEVTDLKDLRRLVKELGYGEPAVFQVERDRRLTYLAMQLD